MRSMGHPDYVYRPRTDEVRKKLSDAHKRRLGTPLDCNRIYGVFVPTEHAEKIRAYAAIVAKFRDFETARQFVESAKNSHWDIERPEYTSWGERDWALYRELIAEGMSREDVAAFAKVVPWYLNKGVWAHRQGRKK